MTDIMHYSANIAQAKLKTRSLKNALNLLRCQRNRRHHRRHRHRRHRHRRHLWMRFLAVGAIPSGWSARTPRENPVSPNGCLCWGLAPTRADAPNLRHQVCVAAHSYDTTSRTARPRDCLRCVGEARTHSFLRAACSPSSSCQTKTACGKRTAAALEP